MRFNCDSRLSVLWSIETKSGFGVNTPGGVVGLLDVSDVVVDLLF